MPMMTHNLESYGDNDSRKEKETILGSEKIDDDKLSFLSKVYIFL